MMIGILDPALFLPREPGTEHELKAELDALLQTCREARISIYTLEEYWPQLWRELGRALDKGLRDRGAKQALEELRKRGTAPKIPSLTTPLRGKVYGFQQLFSEIGEGWLDRMTRAVVRATSSGEQTVLLVRRLDGRNIRRHRADHSVIDEPTRWHLYLHIAGRPPTPVLCVHHPRNLRSGLHWTTRFDWRLPAAQDGASHPFCPPKSWYRGATKAVVTMQSKPVWLDAGQRGWARPNISDGSGHHWDVYLQDPNLIQRIGLSQLNIVQFGSPPEQGRAGTIHHLPEKKKPRLRDDAGWSC